MIRVGVQLVPQGTTIRELRQAWTAVDKMGVDSIHTWDHFVPERAQPDGTPVASDSPIFECWSLMAAMAVTTENAMFGPLVSAVSYRNVNLIAHMAQTIDHLSDGRFILGLGAGWYEPDYVEYGYEFGTAGSRLEYFSNALAAIKERLAVLNPSPAGDLPIMIGGTGPKVTLRLVARYASLWNCALSDPAAATRLNKVIDDWCAVEGTDPRKIERSANVRPDTNIDAWREAGIDRLIVPLRHPFDVTKIERFLDARDAS